MSSRNEESLKFTGQTKLIDMNDNVYSTMSWAVYNIGLSLEPKFKIYPELKEVFRNLLFYFTGNECDYDLTKGIYLYGSYGIGKTLTMSIFSKFISSYFPFSANCFGSTSVERIAEYYKLKGDLFKYGRNIITSETNKGRGTIIENNSEAKKYCVNEFGKKLNEKHYGTDVQDVINSMLMIRYELFQEKGILTHATSNFEPSDLDCFDSALLDRFSEMFNFIEIKGDSKR